MANTAMETDMADEVPFTLDGLTYTEYLENRKVGVGT